MQQFLQIKQNVQTVLTLFLNVFTSYFCDIYFSLVATPYGHDSVMTKIISLLVSYIMKHMFDILQCKYNM